MLFNLLTNAIKFSDRGVVVLDVHRAGAGDGGAQLEFVVTDTGIGMDAGHPGAAVPALLAGRRVALAAPWRHRPGPGDLAQPGAPDGWRHHGGAAARPGQRFACACPAARAATRRRRRCALTAADARRLPQGRCACWWPRTTRSTASTWRRCSSAWATAPLRRQRPGGGAGGARAALRHRADGPAHAGAGRHRRHAWRSARCPTARRTVPIVALTADAFAETRQRCLMAGMNDLLAKPVSPEKLAAMLRRLFGSAAAPWRDAARAPG